MDRAIERELQQYLKHLPDDELVQVLDHVRTLVSKGVIGRPGQRWCGSPVPFQVPIWASLQM